MIASSPNVVCCCRADAWSNNACDLLPSATSNDFSACSCLPANSIAFCNPLIKPLAAKNAPPTLRADDANPFKPLSTLRVLDAALSAPLTSKSKFTFLVFATSFLR